MNKLKGIILVVSICFASIMMPFNIYAESIDSHIRGRNYNFEVIQTEQVNSNNIYVNSGIYHVTFVLDDNYIGYILPNYTIQYKNYFYGSNPPNWGNTSSSFSRRVFINGSSFTFDVPITWYSNGPFSVNGGSDPYVYDSYTISSSDVTKTSDIDSLDQIISILTDLYNSQDQVEGLLNNQLTQLQLVVSNTSLANQYLDTLTKMKDWDIPIESFSFVSSFFNKGFEEIGFNQFNKYLYPIFKVNSNSEIISFWGSTNDKFNSYKMIFFIDRNIYLLSILNQYFTLSDGQFLNFTGLNRFRYNNRTSYIISVEIGNFTSEGNKTITYSYSDYSSIIPIYFNYSSFNLLSTDFALNFGLSNQLLDDIHTIANGTQASNSASQQLDSDTSDFVTDRDDLVDIEDNMGDNMDSAMNQITPNNNGLSGFGGNFLTSAVWVRTQFERLTNNTPYGSLIVYGMTLGLALLLLGKVML